MRRHSTRGEGQAEDHRARDHAKDLPHDPGRQIERHEGDDRRQNPERDGDEDLAGAADGRLQVRVALLLVGVYVFAHDDRVVDEDAQHQDEAEERDGAERHPERAHQSQGAEKRQRNPETHPERELGPQEGAQEEQDEQDSDLPAAGQSGEAVRQHRRAVPPDGELDALGQARRRFRHVGLQGPRDREGALIADSEHADHDGGVAVEAHGLVRVLEPVNHTRVLSHVGQQHPYLCSVPSPRVNTTRRSNSGPR